MSIEENLARLADAQERTATAIEAVLAILASAPTGGVVVAKAPTTRKAPPKATDTPPPAEEQQPDPEPEKDPLDEGDPLDDAPAEPEVKKWTEDEVRAALKSYREINGGDAVMTVLEEHGGGAKGMGSLKPEFYAAVMKEVR